MPGLHARFGPSKAARVVECPASLLEDEKYTDTARFEAAQGTAAHTLAERILAQGGVASMFLGEIIEVEGFKIEVDDEMVEGVTRYVAWCAIMPGDHYAEQKVDITPWCPIPEQFGTADHAACMPGRLNVTDLKYGKGVQVFAEENYQAILYALGFINEWDWLYDFKKVCLRICQPRLDHFDEWETTKEHLLQVGEYIKARFALAMLPNPPFGPSKKACQFCKASGNCRAQAEHINSVYALAFDDLDGDFVNRENELSVEELVHAWNIRKLYEMRLKAVERRLIRMMMDREEVPGLKTVEGRSRRKFKSEADARKFLVEKMRLDLDTVAPRKTLSPAKVEKMLPPQARKALEPLWTKPPGRPTLADIRDKRPAYEIHDLAAFNDLDVEDNEDGDE